MIMMRTGNSIEARLHEADTHLGSGAMPSTRGVADLGRPGPGSAGRPPEQLLDTAALAFGRTACASIASSHRDSFLARRSGRAVVGIALGGSRCADAPGNDPQDDHDAFASLLAQPHLVTGLDRMRGLDPCPVDPDVPGPAGTRRGRTGPGQPHRPDPAVHPPRLLTCHSATVMRRVPRKLRAVRSADYRYSIFRTDRARQPVRFQ